MVVVILKVTGVGDIDIYLRAKLQPIPSDCQDELRVSRNFKLDLLRLILSYITI